MIPESRDERALLVYAHRKRARGPAAVLHVAEVMDELKDLVLAAGAKVVASRVQSVDAENPATVVGKGTLVRLKEEIGTLGRTWWSSRTCSSRSSRRFSRRRST